LEAQAKRNGWVACIAALAPPAVCDLIFGVPLDASQPHVAVGAALAMRRGDDDPTHDAVNLLLVPIAIPELLMCELAIRLRPSPAAREKAPHETRKRGHRNSPAIECQMEWAWLR